MDECIGIADGRWPMAMLMSMAMAMVAAMAMATSCCSHAHTQIQHHFRFSPLDEFDGVTCDLEGNIVGIDLSGSAEVGLTYDLNDIVVILGDYYISHHP